MIPSIWPSRRQRPGSCGRPQRGQSAVEYGLIVAVVAVVAMAGLRVLSESERQYFNGFPQQTTATPTSVPPVTGATHMPLVSVFCDRIVVYVGQDATCYATVQDVYTGQTPSSGTFDWTVLVQVNNTFEPFTTTALGFESKGRSVPLDLCSGTPDVYSIFVSYTPPVGSSGWLSGTQGHTVFTVLAPIGSSTGGSCNPPSS